MAVDRLERINSLLKRVIAESVHVVMQGDPVKPGLFTVTSVACGKDLRDATVKVSVFGDDSVKELGIKHLSRNARRFQEIINREVRLKFTPRLTFQLDKSLEKGDEVLSIIDRIERLNKEAPAKEEAPQPAE
ncbi:MAG: 30S ribosome-binding factor RbfA [Kiritimatiellae bacterium]|nr:30S ribosome-binding factor RbfA [Kiritimatiellia bacterium]